MSASVMQKEAIDAIEALQTCAKMIAHELASNEIDEAQASSFNRILNSISTQIEAINGHIVFPWNLSSGSQSITDAQKIELLAGASTTFNRVQSLFSTQF